MTVKPAPDYPVITITPDSGGGGGGGVTVHSALTGRSTTNQHPGTAVSLTAPPGTGNLDPSVVNAQLLADAVDGLSGSVLTVSDLNGVATVRTSRIILDTVASGETAVGVELPDDGRYLVHIEHTGVTAVGLVSSTAGPVITLAPGDIVIAACAGGAEWTATQINGSDAAAGASIIETQVFS